MLVSFKVKNFLSFNDEIEFSMATGQVRSKMEQRVIINNDLSLLKFSAIYGANASGKSNLIKAMNFSKNYILNSKLEIDSKRKYCRTFTKNKDELTKFEYQIEINKKIYSYGFELNLFTGSLYSEWLYELFVTTNNSKLIFYHDVKSNKFEFSNSIKTSPGFNRLKIYAEDISKEKSLLFLTTMNMNKKEFYNNYSSFRVFEQIYRWFLFKFKVCFPNQRISDFSYFAIKEKKENIISLLDYFKTNIYEFELINYDMETLQSRLPQNFFYLVKQFLRFNKNVAVRGPNKEFFILEQNNETDNINVKSIKFLHLNSDDSFAYDEESDGTIRLLDLFEIILSDNDATFVIDEFDRCLHPDLTRAFVEKFIKENYYSAKQLIITTHEQKLMDLSFLRRDCFWFVEKDDKNNTDLYSLEEFKERNDKDLEKNYFAGRYGGLPTFLH